MESGLQSVWAVCGAGVRASASKFSEAQPLHHSTSHTFLQGTTRLFQWESTEMTLLEAVWRDGRKGVKCVLRGGNGWVSGWRQKGEMASKDGKK